MLRSAGMAVFGRSLTQVATVPSSIKTGSPQEFALSLQVGQKIGLSKVDEAQLEVLDLGKPTPVYSVPEH